MDSVFLILYGVCATIYSALIVANRYVNNQYSRDFAGLDAGLAFLIHLIVFPISMLMVLPNRLKED